MVYFHSGLLGVYKTSSDTKTLLAQETEGERAAGAIGLFCHMLKNMIGAFAAAPGKLRQYYSSDNHKSKARSAGLSIDLRVTMRWWSKPTTLFWYGTIQ
jgi:hypothetical protein